MFIRRHMLKDFGTNKYAPILFCAAAITALWLVGSDRLSRAMDEDIYLEVARRVIGGEMPYRDFFALTGPASFLMQAAVFSSAGVSYQSGRFLVIIEVAAIAVCIFWITMRLGSSGAGILAHFFFCPGL